jgi:hypothetical protein
MHASIRGVLAAVVLTAAAPSAFANVIPAQKRLRPAIGGWLAAREPVGDGEGWGCDRVT